MAFLTARFAEAVIALWGVLTIVFFVTQLGDPTILLLPVGATADQIDALRTSLGLNLPLFQQYIGFLVAILHGDFGTSFQYNQPALEVVLQRLPATALLAGCALLLGTVIGTVAGAIAAVKRGTAAELAVMIAALVGQATPVFWLGIMLILVFAVNLGWVPTGGMGNAANLVLPTVTLGVFVSASIARLLRSSLLEIMREDYVRTARAKGLLPITVFSWHVARNALIPVVTMIGIITGELLGGSVVTETVFAWPGVGRLIVQAIGARDFPVIEAGIAVNAAVFVLINLVIDFIYTLLDPRIRQRQ